MTKKKKAEKQSEASASAELFDVKSMQFWRRVAQSVLPEEHDEWRLGEVATTLRLQTALLAENWDEINRIAAKTGNTMSVSWTHKSDRSSTPPSIKVSGSYAEKHPMSAESDVADPNQDELPGIVEEDDKPEEEERPRVRAGTSDNDE